MTQPALDTATNFQRAQMPCQACGHERQQHKGVDTPTGRRCGCSGCGNGFCVWPHFAIQT